MVQQGKTKIERIVERIITFRDNYSNYESVRVGRLDLDRVNDIYDCWFKGLEKQAERFNKEMEEKYGKKKT